MAPVEPSVREWLQIIRGEFAEVPGLHLTKKQFQRLWGLDGQTVETVLDVLVGTNFLRHTADDAYVRASIGQ